MRGGKPVYRHLSLVCDLSGLEKPATLGSESSRDDERR
jgi:hypothetical protein